jgi:homoserine O-acetyltransferase
MSADGLPDIRGGECPLQSGLTYRGARLAYKTYGELDAKRSNAIVYCTPFGAQHTDIEFMIGAGNALDPTKYFIIVPNLFGNGLSSSPSNTRPPFDGSRYPQFTIYDNVMVQHRLITEALDIAKLRLVYGWSMGGIQAYHWAACFRKWLNESPWCVARHGARRITSYSWKA